MVEVVKVTLTLKKLALHLRVAADFTSAVNWPETSSRPTREPKIIFCHNLTRLLTYSIELYESKL